MNENILKNKELNESNEIKTKLILEKAKLKSNYKEQRSSLYRNISRVGILNKRVNLFQEAMKNIISDKNTAISVKEIISQNKDKDKELISGFNVNERNEEEESDNDSDSDSNN